MECRVTGLPADLPLGAPLHVEVGYDTDGRIAAGRAALDSGVTADSTIVRPYALPPEQIPKHQEQARSLIGEPKETA